MYEEGNGHGPGSDLDALKAYLMMQIMYNPDQDEETLISGFLESYYGKAAPYIRLYMDTMHGAIADTDYYMRENFDHKAAFLTPMALLTSAQAMAQGAKLVATDSVRKERIEVAKLAVYCAHTISITFSSTSYANV